MNCTRPSYPTAFLKSKMSIPAHAKMSVPIYAKMSVPIYAFLLHFSSLSSCSCPNSDPGFSSNFQPAVTRVSSTSVVVQWTKSHVQNFQCGDNFIVKHWPARDPRRYKISDLLPLKVRHQDIVSPFFNYTKTTGTFSYLARGLYLLKNSYFFQVVVTENRPIMGRSWYRSVPTMQQADKVEVSVRSREKEIDRFMLRVVLVIVILAAILVVVGTVYNVVKCITDDGNDEDELELGEDFDPDYNFETNLDAFTLERKQLPGKTVANGQIVSKSIKKDWPPIKAVIASKAIDQQTEIKALRKMFSKNDTDPYDKSASDFVFFLKTGNLTRKAIRDVLCPRSGKQPSRRAANSSRRTVVSVKRGVISSRRERLSMRKDRIPARKTVLSARTIRKLHQQNPAAARLFSYKKIS